MRADDGKKFTNVAAAAITADTFLLDGGVYTMDAIASNWGTAALQRLGPDGTTYLTLDTALALSANGTSGPVALLAGRYRVNAAGITAAYISVLRVPGE